MSRDFLLQVFSWITFPQAPENSIRVISNFFENLRRYSQVKVHHRCQRQLWQICRQCQWYRRQFATDINFATSSACVVDTGANCHRCQRRQWQIMGKISGCRHLKVNLRAKLYIHVNSSTQRCPNKLIKIFLIENFFICHRCQRHQWCTLNCKYLREFRNGPNGILRGLEETDSWKKPEVENLVALSL